jgi:putative dimethyl sulfoxide reductase chaperone
MGDMEFATSAHRADLARLLAACYYQPGPEFADDGLFSAMQAAASIDSELSVSAQRLAAAFETTPLQELLIDYTSLFLGPSEPLALPYGSIWLTGEKTLNQESTLAAKALYERAGFEIDESFKDLPDHIAVELEFLYVLLFREVEFRHKRNEEDLDGNAALRRQFLDEHLGRWIGPFAAAVRANARTDFYRELAELTELFVRRERSVLRT